ncbi:hypothetical protein [Enterococcus sp. DIV1368e]|uniref:hypothetical protein n=1 Tax=unclassified Enterococcus TaxID=2608891 RepID=UPI003F243008
MENKKDKFVRLGESRVNDAIKKIRLIGNLSNKNNYEYTSEQVNEIITVLKSEIEDVQKKFTAQQNKRDDKFQFRKRSENL